MYPKIPINQKGLAPMLVLFIAVLIVFTSGLGIALYNSSKNGSLGFFDSGDRSFDTRSLSGSISSLFRSITSAQKTDDNAKPPDHTRLTLGDHRFSTSPQKGYIYTCNKTLGRRGGSGTVGLWIDEQAKTWDLTKKVAVDGSIAWHDAKWTITADKTTRNLSGNGLPKNHPTGIFPVQKLDDAYQFDKNPNSLKEQSIAISLPVNPTITSIPECVGGEVGIMLSGIPIFSGFDAEGRDAVAWEVQDGCGGHPQQDGVYHYHGPSKCLENNHEKKEHSPLVGYAFDGFGIYGTKGANGVEVSTAALDECHGHSHQINWDGQNVDMYHYHLTNDFPYSVSCFRGKNAVSGPTRGKFGAEPAGQNQQTTQQVTGNSQQQNVSYDFYYPTGNSVVTYQPILNNQQWYYPSFDNLTPCSGNNVNSSCSGIAPALNPNNPTVVTTPAPAPAPAAAPGSNNDSYVASQAPPSSNESLSTPAPTKRPGVNGSGNENFGTASFTESQPAAPTPTPVPVCSAQPSGSSSTVNSASSVTWTYNYPETSKINYIELKPTAGIKYSVNGNTSESGQGLIMSLADQTTVQFTVLLDNACSSFTVNYSVKNVCGATFGGFVGFGSSASFGAFCQ